MRQDSRGGRLCAGRGWSAIAARTRAPALLRACRPLPQQHRGHGDRGRSQRVNAVRGCGRAHFVQHDLHVADRNDGHCRHRQPERLALPDQPQREYHQPKDDVSHAPDCPGTLPPGPVVRPAAEPLAALRCRGGTGRRGLASRLMVVADLRISLRLVPNGTSNLAPDQVDEGDESRSCKRFWVPDALSALPESQLGTHAKCYSRVV